MKAKFLVPLLLFFGLAGFLAFGLTLNPREVPSPLIDKPAPGFRLARVDDPASTFALEEMRGQVWLLNVWASWCALNVRGMALEAETALAVERARGWLSDHGDPYVLSVLDVDGRVGIDFGVYGVPETFLIDAEGRIRYKHIGPITPDSLQQVIMPKVEELRRAG